MNLQALYDWIFHQNADGTGLPLKPTGVVLGLLLIAAHLGAWAAAEKAMGFARAFPRHRAWGVVLLLVATVWSFFLVGRMDMGEFHAWRRWLLMLVPATFVLVAVYVPEFLAVRALGAVLLLAASPVLHAAFLQPQASRLLLPGLAYAWIISGMFFVGMPFVLRDWITWLTQSPARWKAASLAGAGYGAMLLLAALLWY